MFDIDYSHHHHSVFSWMGFTVKNHYDIENRYASRKGREIDDLLKQLALENRKEKDGVWFPSDTFNGMNTLSIPPKTGGLAWSHVIRQ